MKLPPIIDNPGQRFLLLAFHFSIFMAKGRVDETHATHLPQRLRACVWKRERELNGAERKWIVAGNSFGDMLFYCLFHTCMSLLTGLLEPISNTGRVLVEEWDNLEKVFSKLFRLPAPHSDITWWLCQHNTPLTSCYRNHLSQIID